MNRALVLMLALLVAMPAAAEVYRWTDAKGGVHYSDQPPPPSIRDMKRIAAPESGTSANPAGSRPPVVLYSGNCGPTCSQAADYLRQRGVPFSLKDASKDPKAAADLKQRTGGLEVPVLFIGESMQRGYSPTVWDKMLEVAGYAAPAKSEGTPAAAPAAGTPSE